LINNLQEYSYTGIGRDDGKQDGEYTAIFYKKSRFSLLGTDNFWLSETPEYPSLGWDAVCIRICTYVKLSDNITKKEFIHYNTHLDHVGQTAKVEGAKLIKKRVFDNKMPAVITGDFNFHENSAPYNEMAGEGIKDAKYSAELSMSYGTFHKYGAIETIEQNSPIDYIFYTGNDFKILEYKVLVNGSEGEHASDHYPVLVTLK
jgi:endonuclease/exonuclease/phosphatase family metal-dependent hydrolase